jgi:hypothetical protein
MSLSGVASVAIDIRAQLRRTELCGFSPDPAANAVKKVLTLQIEGFF